MLGGILFAVGGYAIVLGSVLWQFGYDPNVIPRLIAVTVACVIAAVVAVRGHPVLGGVATIVIVWAEIQYGFYTSPTVPGDAIVILPALAVAIGLLHGVRSAFLFTLATFLVTIGTHRLSPSVRATGFTDLQVHEFVMFGIGLAATWGLIALTLSGFRRVIAELTARERDLEDTLRFSPGGILVLDEASVVLSANPAASETLAVPADRLVGRSLCAVLAEASAEPATPVIAPATTDESPTSLELKPRDGASVHVEATWRRMEGGRHQVMFRDVSERVRAEMARRSREAEEASEKRIEAVGELAGGLSHDFNNILTIVSGSVELLRNERDPALRAILFDEILAAHDRGAALTRQLLAFARREALHPVWFDLADKVRSLEPRLVRVAGDAMPLQFDLAPECGVRVDPLQLEQVLVRLLANAREAMPHGGPCEIRVRRHESEGHPPQVWLQVSDQGVGMTDAVAARAFEPFFTTKGRAQGTGLGLAVVHGMAAQSGGAARIASAPGRGTTVTIELPFVEAPREAGRLPAGIPRGTSTMRTILLVEDDAGTRATVARMLKSAGYAVRVAADGIEALRLIERERLEFDLLLSDVMMPGLNGPALAARVRATCPQLPVLLMTGYAEEDLGGLRDAAERRDVITKPFSSADLVERLTRLFDGAPLVTG